jgi:polyhydroxyalkanoate synthase
MADLAQIQSDYIKNATDMWNQSLQRRSPMARPRRCKLGDKRFAARNGRPEPGRGLTAQMYLLNARTLMQMAESVRGRRQDQGPHPLCGAAVGRRRVAQQLPGAQPRSAEEGADTKGESIARACSTCWGSAQGPCVADRRERLRSRPQRGHHGRARWCSRTSFFQLIEYKPLTAKVHERPMLFVPPCINKFYILDLQPDNSVIRYTVEQGHRTFVVSWRNPDESLAGRPGTTTSSTAPSGHPHGAGHHRRRPASTCWASASAAPSWPPRWPCWPRAANSRRSR